MSAKLKGRSAIVLLSAVLFAGVASASTPVATAATLAGTWKAKTESLPLTGDFNEQVWGKGAQSVRDVTLAIRPTGDATLTIARKVVDRSGKVVPGSARTEVSDLAIGDGQPGFATRIDHAVQVRKAERRYSNAPDDKWPLDNLRVSVVSFTDAPGTLEVRFDPADGQGAFAEMVTRVRAGRP